MKNHRVSAALSTVLLAFVPCRVGAAGAVGCGEPPQAVHYIMTSDGDSIFVRGAISCTRDVVQKYGLKGYGNGAIDYFSAFLLAPEAGNTLAAYGAGEQMYSIGLDAAPINTGSCGHVGASHGFGVPVVTSTGHDKTVGDIGSYWSDGTRDFILAGITGDRLVFYPCPYPWGKTWRMPASVVDGVLTHVAGAGHPGAIAVTSQTYTEQYPVVRNRTVQALRDGAALISGGEEGSADFVDLVEEYDLIDPSTINRAQTTNPWVWNDADAWIHVRNVHRALAGRTEIRMYYAFQRSMYVGSFFTTMLRGLTSATHANRYYYFPKTRSASGAYDWTAPQLVNETGVGSINFTADSITSTANPPDRLMMLWERAGAANYDVAVVHGYSPLPATPTPRTIQLGNYWYMLALTMKSYPIFYGTSVLVPAGTIFDIWAYRQWVDQSQSRRGKYCYWNTANQYGDDIVFVDYHEAVCRDTTVLPERVWGRSVTVVDTLNVLVHSCSVSPAGITISTTPGDTLGYAVLRLTDSNVRVDDPARSCRLGPPAPNPSCGTVALSYTVTRTGRVRLEVHDLHGRRVRTLVDAEQCPGTRAVVWDGADETGTALGAGMYFARFAAPGTHVSRKVVRVR